jgi:hypothetical protein
MIQLACALAAWALFTWLPPELAGLLLVVGAWPAAIAVELWENRRR